MLRVHLLRQWRAVSDAVDAHRQTCREAGTPAALVTTCMTAGICTAVVAATWIGTTQALGTTRTIVAAWTTVGMITTQALGTTRTIVAAWTTTTVGMITTQALGPIRTIVAAWTTT